MLQLHFFPSANSPNLVDGPSAIISPDLTLSPTLTKWFLVNTCILV